MFFSQIKQSNNIGLLVPCVNYKYTHTDCEDNKFKINEIFSRNFPWDQNKYIDQIRSNLLHAILDL